VRVILATNQDLAAAVREGRFREDLYYRIHVVTIELPPLRERPSDIPELARRFLANASADLGRRVHGIAAEAMDALLAYPWPGNVRELENAIERAVATGHSETLQFSDLPAAVRRQDRQSMVASGGTAPAAADSMSLDEVPLGKLSDMLAACERRFLQRALDACRQNRSRAAALLGLHRATLYQRMKRAGFGTPDRP
jgi:DNA-binding NtrC family response regulator